MSLNEYVQKPTGLYSATAFAKAALEDATQYFCY